MQLRQPLNLRQPLQMTAHKIRPTLNLPFAASGILGPLITYTGQNGTYFNSSGTLTAATTNVARFDYNPSTLIARGLLIEEARTNSLRNNTMVGASAGTPGTAPTNWGMSSTGGNITRTISGLTTENGITYMDVRYVFSAAATAYVPTEGNTQVVASSTQVWTASVYTKLSAGSLSNITISNSLSERDGAGGYLAETTTAIVPTSASLATQRTATTRTLNNGATAFVNQTLIIAASAAADITLRIGMPQLELGAFATSVISTSTVAVTRAADVPSITGANFTSFWNATQGTIVSRFIRAAAAGGTGRVFTVSDGTINQSIRINTSSDIRPDWQIVDGGVLQVNITGNTVAAGAVITEAAAYRVNDFAAAQSGALLTPDTSGTIPTVDRMFIGSNDTGTVTYLNGWISSLAYYPVRLTNSQLQTLST